MTHFIDTATDKVLALNTTDIVVVIRKGIRVGTIIEYREYGAYQVDPILMPLAIKPRKRSSEGEL